MRGPPAASTASVALLIVGCGLVPIDAPGAPDVPEPDVGLVMDCEPPFVFEGETTIAELGLDHQFPGIGDHATRRGTIRITRDTVTHDEFMPPGVPAVVEEGQLLCLTLPGGAGMTAMLREPFGAEATRAAEGGGGDGLPVAPILAGLSLTLVGAVSWLAFRREQAASS
jgi:hypothetical protein